MHALDIYVVDNASIDGSVDMVRSLFPSVHVIARQDRGSYAENQNLILKQVNTEYVWILNEDTIIGAGVLGDMLSAMEQYPQAGIVGVTILNPDGSLQATCMRFPTVRQKILTRWFGWVARFRPSGRLPFNGSLSDREHRRFQRVDWVNGASRLVRRQVLDDVGVLDEGLPIFYEETDQARLARNAGWSCLYSPRTHVWHVQGASRRSQEEKDKMHRILEESTYYYFRKHRGVLAMLTVRFSDVSHHVLARTFREILSKLRWHG